VLLGNRRLVEVAAIDAYIARQRAAAVGLTAEQCKAADNMVARRMQNTGESNEAARKGVADALRSVAAEAETRGA
jgi:hypothetical protein